MAQQATAAGAAGMAGMVAGETAIAAALQDALLYRGYEIADLAEHATFEEVAFLLLEGHRPDASELDRFSKELRGERGLPDRVSAFLDESGELFRSGAATAMDLLRTGVSILGHVDPECQDNAPEAELNKSKRLLAKIPQMIGRMQASIEQRDAVAPDSSLGHAANLFKQLTRRTPTEREERAFDVSLILYAEHDFNASTFTTRVIAATLSDLHSAIAGGIGALKGPLHGGANEAAIEMLLELREAAGKGDSVDSWMQRAFAEHRKLMGFGHRVYKQGDHRAPILHELGRGLAQEKAEAGDASFVELFDLGERVQTIMREQKSIHPNVDFPCGLAYFTMGIPIAQYTPIFVASRVAGWSAHVMEQHANNRLIRPGADYTGPAQRAWNA